MYFLIALPPVLILLSFIFGYTLSAPVYAGKRSKHFNGKQFENYDKIKASGFKDLIKWLFSRDPGPWHVSESPSHTKPASKEEKPRIYFVNHSTFLIQWKNINILTDPIWSARTSPFEFAGPKRMRLPGIPYENLPEIHLVILSHNHYDHLDIKSIKKLWNDFKPQLLVPLGVDKYLIKEGIQNVTALDWWESHTYKSLKFDMVPAQHFSGRGMFDRDRTLWAGYMISDQIKKVYFVGDTGYNERMFEDIKSKHPNIDLAMIPIGAYKPKWFMSPIHISPEQAVKIHVDLNIKKSIAMHYNTFPLADDGQEDPKNDLEKALSELKLSKQAFITLPEGEYTELPM